MKKSIVVLMLMLFMATVAQAYSDADMDGVEDSVDKCPNTPFTDLVDIDGCTKKKLNFSVANTQKTQGYFDLIVGANYAGANYGGTSGKTDTFFGNIQADYYYGNFSLQASTGYYTSSGDGYSDNGMNDSFIGAAYNLKPVQNLIVRFGIGALLPTYETTLGNNKTDYSATLNLSYNIDKLNLFGGYGYTKINDTDVFIDSNNSYTYQDVQGYSAGIGYYFTTDLYMSVAYNSANSVYKNVQIDSVNSSVEDIQTASLYGYYALSKERFVIFNYAYGLSDSASDHAASVKLGFYF